MKISKREKEVLDLISREFSTPEIALELYISVETVKSHRKNLLTKLNAKNSPGIVRRGFELGLLSISKPKNLSFSTY